MDVGQPVQDSVGNKAEVAGREGSKLMNAVEGLMLAGATMMLVEDLTRPKMRAGTSILDATGSRGEVVGRSQGDLFYTLVEASMIIGAFELAQDLSGNAPAQKQEAKVKNTQKPTA